MRGSAQITIVYLRATHKVFAATRCGAAKIFKSHTLCVWLLKVYMEKSNKSAITVKNEPFSNEYSS